jgi:hypothetical protein
MLSTFKLLFNNHLKPCIEERADSTMAKRQRYKGTNYHLHRKLKTERHEPHENGLG